MNQEGSNKKIRNKPLIAILSILVVVILALASLIIYNFLKPEPEKTLDEKNTILETTLAEFNEKYPNANEDDYESVFSAYQDLIDSVEDGRKAELLTEEIYFLIDYDINSKYKDLALEKANVVEDILHDLTSAINFTNIATKYNLPDLYEKYSTIYEKRGEEINSNQSQKPGKEYIEEKKESE